MMVYEWEPGTQYDYGAIVVYEGHKYKIVTPHRSQSDWTPPLTPALWGRLPEEYHEEEHRHHEEEHRRSEGNYNPGYGQEQQPLNQGYQQGYGDEKRPENHGQQSNERHEEEKKKHHILGMDVDDKDLKIGGGILAGLAATAGIGYVAYQHHEKSEQKKEQQKIANVQHWEKDALIRTEQHRSGGLRAPTMWVLTEGHRIPQDAFPGGHEQGQTLYICRAFHDGGVQVGKAATHLQTGGVIGYGEKEIAVERYEILLANPQHVHWVPVHGRLNVRALGARPVEGGWENNNTPLYIAQAEHNNSVHPGKASEKLDGAFIPYGNTEVKVLNYRVLCYNN